MATDVYETADILRSVRNNSYIGIAHKFYFTTSFDASEYRDVNSSSQDKIG